MKILIVCQSPFLLTSVGKLSADIITHLFSSNHSIACAVYGHNTSYFLPETGKNGEKIFYFHPVVNQMKYDVPIIPITKSANDSIVIYELLNMFKPDTILTIGDYTDFTYMKAVKMFYEEKIKWVSILTNHSYPIHENNIEIFDLMDSILCTNKFTYNMIYNITQRKMTTTDIVRCAYVGSDVDCNNINVLNKELRVTCCGKNSQSDNLPTIIECFSNVHEKIKPAKLIVCSNIYDKGDFDFTLLQKRFDPNGLFIDFPEQYISIYEGMNRTEFSQMFCESNIYIDTSMSSPTYMNLFNAIACGNWPIVTESPETEYLMKDLSEFCGIPYENFIISSNKIMSLGEIYLHICDPKDLQRKIINVVNILKDSSRNFKNTFKDFGKKYSRKGFLEKVLVSVNLFQETESTMIVDTV